MTAFEAMGILTARFRALEAARGKLDHSYALWVVDVEEAKPCKADRDAYYTGTLGLWPSTVTKLHNMAEAVRIVPDPGVWAALGYPKVRDVARIENAKAREKACARILAEHAKATKNVKTAKVPKIAAKHVDVILAEEAPEVFAPKPPVPETRKDREQAAMARKPAAISASQNDHGATKAWAVVRRLVETAPALLRPLLTDEEARAAGLPRAALRSNTTNNAAAAARKAGR